MEIVALGLVGLPFVGIPVVVGFCRAPALSKLGRQAKITGACVAVGAAGIGLAQGISSQRTSLTRTASGLRINRPVPLYLDERVEDPLRAVGVMGVIGGLGNGAWTAGHGARCVVSAAFGAATGSGGPRV